MLRSPTQKTAYNLPRLKTCQLHFSLRQLRHPWLDDRALTPQITIHLLDPPLQKVSLTKYTLWCLFITEIIHVLFKSIHKISTLEKREFWAPPLYAFHTFNRFPFVRTLPAPRGRWELYYAKKRRLGASSVNSNRKWRAGMHTLLTIHCYNVQYTKHRWSFANCSCIKRHEWKVNSRHTTLAYSPMRTYSRRRPRTLPYAFAAPLHLRAYELYGFSRSSYWSLNESLQTLTQSLKNTNQHTGIHFSLTPSAFFSFASSWRHKRCCFFGTIHIPI